MSDAPPTGGAAGRPSGGECPECGGTLAAEGTETVCRGCGLVAGRDAVDRGPEWRVFEGDDADQKARVGSSLTESMHDRGLSTVVGRDATDARGNALAPERRRRLARLRRRDRWAKKDGADRGLKKAFAEVKRMRAALDLSTAAEETACALYRTCRSEGVLSGRSIEGVATACLLVAARQLGAARAADEFARVARVGGDRVRWCLADIQRELSVPVPPQSPAEFVPRTAAAVGACAPVRRAAEAVAHAAHEAGVDSGRDPTVVAAGAVYAAGRVARARDWPRRPGGGSDGPAGTHDGGGGGADSGPTGGGAECAHQVVQEDLADAADCSVVAVRQNYQWLLPWVRAAPVDVDALAAGGTAADLEPLVETPVERAGGRWSEWAGDAGGVPARADAGGDDGGGGDGGDDAAGADSTPPHGGDRHAAAGDAG